MRQPDQCSFLNPQGHCLKGLLFRILGEHFSELWVLGCLTFCLVSNPEHEFRSGYLVQNLFLNGSELTCATFPAHAWQGRGSEGLITPSPASVRLAGSSICHFGLTHRPGTGARPSTLPFYLLGSWDSGPTAFWGWAAFLFLLGGEGQTHSTSLRRRPSSWGMERSGPFRNVCPSQASLRLQASLSLRGW